MDVARGLRTRALASMEIGVVGAGASTVCLLDALATLGAPIGRITVFDPEEPWVGRPYAEDVAAVRVNGFPEDMSVRAGDADHFARWLTSHAPGTPIDPGTGTRFPPRAVYGDYLRDSARGAIDRLRALGWYVGVERTRVVGAIRTAERIVLRTATGRHHAVDHMVLCVGGGRPRQAYPLDGAPGYVPDPYPARESLAGVGRRDRVAVLGSGLSAVDVVLSLVAQGHQGLISLVSRSGVLPGVRQRPLPFELNHFTPARLRSWSGRLPVRLADVVDLMRRELLESGQSFTALAAELSAVGEDPLARLRRHIDAVTDSDLGLRVLQRAVPDCGPDVWPLLPASDRAYVLENHYRTVMSLCCPMPPSTASVLLRLAEHGQLELVPGLTSIRVTGRGFDLDGARPLRADVIVNATSPPSQRIPEPATSLIHSLVVGRSAQQHPHGGVHVERATSRLTVDGVPDPRIYALGDLAAGSLFFTFGIPSLVDRSIDIVRSMVDHAETGQRTSPRVLALR